MCVVYLLDSQFIVDAPKYISGCLVRLHGVGCAASHSPSGAELVPSVKAALSSMLQMELPHVSVLSKVDLLREKKATLDECATVFRATAGGAHALAGFSRQTWDLCPTHCLQRWARNTAASTSLSRRWCACNHSCESLL